MRSAVPRHYRHTFRDYLLIEEMSPEVKHEYLDGEIYAMAGGTPEHSALCARLIAQLVAVTAGGRCEAHTSDLRIRVRATGLATYAHAAVVCGPVERDPESPSHCTNPVAIFEVLSEGTERYDRGEKREHYQRIESLREYFVIAQDRPYAERWSRGEDGRWNHEVIEADRKIVLDSTGGAFSLRDLYRA